MIYIIDDYDRLIWIGLEINLHIPLGYKVGKIPLCNDYLDY